MRHNAGFGANRGLAAEAHKPTKGSNARLTWAASGVILEKSVCKGLSQETGIGVPA